MELSYHKACFLCGSPNIKALKGYEEHELVRCSDCSFVFMHRIPTVEELIDYYSVYAYEQQNTMSEPTRISLENWLMDSGHTKKLIKFLMLAAEKAGYWKLQKRMVGKCMVPSIPHER